MKLDTDIKWEIQVPIFKNILILKQLGLAIGIPFSILIGFLLMHISDAGARYALYLILLTFFLTTVLIYVLYQGKYHMVIQISKSGISVEYPPAIKRKNKVINFLLVFLGLFLKKPGAAGTGLLAASKQSIKIQWKHIRKVKFYPKHKTIFIKGRIGESIGVFCTKDNYAVIETIIQNSKNA
ncbi:MAG: hypothetical protein JXR88_00995 [Clostridia bacterium]|nr:hypothetical protein [Clostridia bacterium]